MSLFIHILDDYQYTLDESIHSLIRRVLQYALDESVYILIREVNRYTLDKSNFTY